MSDYRRGARVEVSSAWLDPDEKFGTVDKVEDYYVFVQMDAGKYRRLTRAYLKRASA